MPWVAIQTVSFAVALGGLLLAILGVAGRRVGEATRCRGCGYDVETILEDQPTCPECGGSIASKRGTVTGSRVRRKGLIVAGVIMLVPASVVAWYVSTVVQPVAARPSWLMAAELRLGPTSNNAELARELQRRWRVGELGSFGQRALVDWGLSAWATPHASRSYAHATVVQLAIAANALSESQIDRFVEQILVDSGDGSNTGRQRVALAVARELGTTIRPRLEAALEDTQTRDAAVVLLLDELGNTPSQGLVEAAIESLAHRPGGPETGPALDRLPLSIEARRAVRYLTHHASICAPALRQELTADDPQRRLLAALALTAAGDAADAPAIGRAVATAFEPNETPGDAVLATRAVLRSGAAALASAETAVRTDDARQRLAEIERALGQRLLPPHLERLAGRLPWQEANQGPASASIMP